MKKIVTIQAMFYKNWTQDTLIKSRLNELL